MHGNAKDPKRPDAKPRIDELEKTNFALAKRVAELEGLLEEREADKRAADKRLRNQEETETHYRGVLENFTKQAKDQYKKYENYLDNAEDLLTYVLTYINCTSDATHSALDALLLGARVDIASHFEYENKAVTESNVRGIVDRFERSQFLRKKKLFVDIKRKMGFRSTLRLTELQEKCDRLAEEAPKKTVTQLKSISLVTDDNLREELFEASYTRLVEHIEKFRETLADGLYANFSAAALSELLKCVSGLSDDLHGYLGRFKESLGGADTPTEAFNADIDAIKRNLDNLEKLEYNKLIELREKNNKLQIIQNHINNLSKENEELTTKLGNNEFNLLVSNEIILAYEKSVREKELALRTKADAIERAKVASDELNARITKLTLELIETESELTQYILMEKDAHAREALNIKELDHRKRLLREAQSKNARQQSRMEAQLQDRNLIEKRVEECDAAIVRLSEGLRKQENEMHGFELKAQERISVVVRSQVKDELNQHKFAFFRSSLFD